MRPAAVIILLIVMASTLVVPTSASSFRVTVEDQHVKASLVLSLHQNVTALPSQEITLNLGSDSALASAFTNGLRNVTRTASPSELTVTLGSAPTWLNITTAITISGVSGRNGDLLSLDMAWRAFNIQTELRTGNLSYNMLGARYFRPVAEFYSNASRFVARPNATITGVSFFVNRTSIAGGTAQNYVGNFSIFNFKALKTPLEGWSRTYSLSNNTTTWRLTPPRPMDFTMVIQRTNRTVNYFATYGYDAEITVPGFARARGDTLVVDVGTGGKELLMGVIVAITIVLAIAAQLFFRAKERKSTKFGRR